MPAGMAGARLETVHPPLQVRSRDKEKVPFLLFFFFLLLSSTISMKFLATSPTSNELGQELERARSLLSPVTDKVDKVADLVKRRMSTRFPAAGETHSPPSIPSIPDMLSIPAGEGARLPPPADPVDRAAAGQALDVDISIFREPSFDAEQCISFSVLTRFFPRLIGMYVCVCFSCFDGFGKCQR
jgi:hypothetical protein